MPRLLPGVERQARRLLKPEAAFIVSEILVDSEREAGGLPSVYREYGSDGREVVGAGYSDRFTVVLWASGGRASAAVGQAWRDVLGALPDTLELNYDKKVDWIELDEVMRQELNSGILYNATELRELLKDSFITEFKFKLRGFKDIVRLTYVRYSRRY